MLAARQIESNNTLGVDAQLELFNIENSIELKDTIFDKIHENSQGFITSAYKDQNTKRKFFSRHFKKNDFKMRKEDSYFSINTFITTKRTKANLYEYTSCFIDLDCEKSGYSKEKMMYILETEIFDYEILRPSLVVDSGHGYYLIWQLDKTVPARTIKNELNYKVFRFWNKIQHGLYLKLKQYGADPQALDCVRVLRNTETENCKDKYEKHEVSLVRDYNVKYSLGDIANEVLVHEDDFKIMLEEQDEINRKKQQHLKVIKNNKAKKKSNYNLKTVNSNRVRDLKRSVKMRKNNKAGKRKRELILFLYRYHACHVYGPLTALAKMHDLNSEFNEPLLDAEQLTDSAERAFFESKETIYTQVGDLKHRTGYNYKTETIIEALELTDEEQSEMITLCNPELKKANKNENERRGRRNKRNLTKRDQSKINKIYICHKLKKVNKSNSEIVKLSKMTKATVSKYLKLDCPSSELVDIKAMHKKFPEMLYTLRGVLTSPQEKCTELQQRISNVLSGALQPLVELVHRVSFQPLIVWDGTHRLPFLLQGVP